MGVGDSLGRLHAYARFAAGLPGFFRRPPMSLEEARETIESRLAAREENFLRTLERSIFGRADGPYRWLMERAGVEMGDIEAEVRSAGVEGTLRSLRDAGVYVTYEEFKGRRPIVRGGAVGKFSPRDFDNPHLQGGYEVRTSGSSGAPVRVNIELDHLAARAPAMLMEEKAGGTLGLPSAYWVEPLPASGFNQILSQVVLGAIPERWYTLVPLPELGALRFRTANRTLLMTAKLCGKEIPAPAFLPLERAGVLAHWAAEARDRVGGSVVRTRLGRAVQIAIAAQEADIDLTGVVLRGGGEPATRAKIAEIEKSGARSHVTYFCAEVGPIGLPCARPRCENDQHFLADHLALIRRARRLSGGSTVDAFLFSTLLPTAPKILLNTEIDDYGSLERRDCGCLLGELGFDVHIHGIRSMGKMTGGGVTLAGSEIGRILDSTLPGRFGGGPFDYQLAEAEGERGEVRVVLRIDPEVDIDSEAEVLGTLVDLLKGGSDAARYAAEVWERSGTFEVRREETQWTPGGKFPAFDSLSRWRGTPGSS